MQIVKDQMFFNSTVDVYIAANYMKLVECCRGKVGIEAVESFIQLSMIGGIEFTTPFTSLLMKLHTLRRILNTRSGRQCLFSV